MTKPSEITIKSWINLVRAQTIALTCIEEAFKQADLPPIEWYDVLLELERSGSAGLRPFELKNQLLLPQYGISRLVTRMEKAKYLIRKTSIKDGRGQLLCITQSGIKTRQQMWKIYAPQIEKAIGSKLDANDANALNIILSKLIK